MRVALSLLVFMLAGWPHHGSAQPVVIECYTGKRPADARRLLAPLIDELAGRGYTSGDSLGRMYEARVSRPASTTDGLSPDFDAAVERGHKAWIAGDFDEAVGTLVPLLDDAHANAATIAQDQRLRQSVQKALVALALSQQRKGDVAAAKDTFQELIRSFPDAQVSAATYGNDAYAFFDMVRRDLGKSGRGRLVVKVPNTAVVFVDERFETVGPLTKGDLFPGTYRVFVQIAKQPSRVHKVEVRPEAEATLVIDPAYEAALRTSGEPTGFEFPDGAARDKHEPGYAARFGNEIGASALAVVGTDVVRGRVSLVGSVIDLRSGKEIRRASLALEPPPNAERIRALGSFLAGGDAAEGLVVEIGAEPSEQDEDDVPGEPTNSPRGWMLWPGIGGAVLGSVVGGALAVKFALDARDAGDELDRVCAVSCTSEQALGLEQKQKAANRNALIAGVAGGAIAITGVTFIVLSRLGKNDSNAVTVVPITGGAYASYTLAF